MALFRVAILFLLLAGRAFALPNELACPPGSSTSASPDGSEIEQPKDGSNSCVLWERASRNSWEYRGETLHVNGQPYTVGFSRVQIASGGKAFLLGACQGVPSQPSVWFENTPAGLVQVISPSGGSLPDNFRNLKQGKTGKSLGIIQAANPGDVLEVLPLPKGVPYYRTASRVTAGNSNNVIKLAAGVVVACVQDEGNAILPVDTGNGPVDHVTIAGPATGVAIVGFLHDVSGGSWRCINWGDANNWAVADLLIVDCDFGLQGNTRPTGTASLTNVVLDGHGGHSSGGASVTHNAYFGNFRPGHHSVMLVRGGGSHCTRGGDGGGPGFLFKTRWVQTTMLGYTLTEASWHGFTGCAESAAIDVSCGGNAVIGGSTPADGIVIQIGHGIRQNGHEFIRYGRDDRTGNCGPGGTPWRDEECVLVSGHACELRLTNCTLINDSTERLRVATIDESISPGRVFIKDCDLIGNIEVGAGVADLGGNRTFADRAAAARRLGWRDNDGGGHPCCDAPWVPPLVGRGVVRP